MNSTKLNSRRRHQKRNFLSFVSINAIKVGAQVYRYYRDQGRTQEFFRGASKGGGSLNPSWAKNTSAREVETIYIFVLMICPPPLPEYASDRYKKIKCENKYGKRKKEEKMVKKSNN